MVTKFGVFSLCDSVCGISNNGLEYDNYSYNISIMDSGICNTEIECKMYIENIILDNKKRKADKNIRFIILPVYCSDVDDIF